MKCSFFANTITYDTDRMHGSIKILPIPCVLRGINCEPYFCSPECRGRYKDILGIIMASRNKASLQ